MIKFLVRTACLVGGAFLLSRAVTADSFQILYLFFGGIFTALSFLMLYKQDRKAA